MNRSYKRRFLRDDPVLASCGLNMRMVGDAVTYVCKILDSIDSKLIQGGGERLSELVELANLSAIIGNLYRSGIVHASEGSFAANAPHTYPDLLANADGCPNIEIKIALETNNPKGHLIKPGAHITLRYVLASEDGSYLRGKENRGSVAYVWEVRVGWLDEAHFNVSNTEGDSGKTAVINAEGMNALRVVYCDLERCPLSPNGAKFREVASLFN